MESHFYAVVTCKSSTCRAESAVKYLGPRSKKVAPLPGDTVFIHECPQCHTDHHYTVGEVRVRAYGFDRRRIGSTGCKL